MQPVRRTTVALVVIGSLTLGALSGAGHALAAGADASDTGIQATLDGNPIPIEDVGKYFCDDFSYPAIQCSSTRIVAQSRAMVVTLLTSVEYVTIYDLPIYQGAFMNVSQDYPALSLIGWNDRISSFRGKNSETGAFYVDWFYSGSWWSWCCNQTTSNLGSYSNVFSSILRT